MQHTFPFSPGRQCVHVAIRLIPKAGRDGVDGVITRADGSKALKVRVTAAPEKGKANAALLGLLAKAWDIPRSRLDIAAGESARDKTVHASGNPDSLMLQLNHRLGLYTKDQGG